MDTVVGSIRHQYVRGKGSGRGGGDRRGKCVEVTEEMKKEDSWERASEENTTRKLN